MSAPIARAALPRGIRNNNPGNIRYDGKTPWQGLDEPASDGEFCRFRTSQDGIRALARILIVYQDAHNVNTIRDAISKWAPPSENNTDAYVDHVVGETGFMADLPLNFHDYATLAPIVKAIILHENGVQPYSDDEVNEGLRRTGVVPATPRSTVLQPGVAPTATVTIGSIISTAGAAMKDGAGGSQKILLLGIGLIAVGALFSYLSARKQRKLSS